MNPLSELAAHHVNTSVRTTLARTIEMMAEDLALEILRDAAVRDRLRTLVLAAFERAWQDLERPSADVQDDEA
jgi:hypothetical protein